ncbi:tpr domain protein [hydrocarbon metagenome]|uniref:Tpr domain protein n=1 Tax=hydrocarbon metagenome TaxID=938273 RepID=A0A0W8FV28_9ZZZZ
MKIKPLYIYLSLFVVVIVVLVIITSGGKTNRVIPDASQNKTMPQDEIHQNLGSAPGGGNVSSEFKQRMENLKSNYETNPKDTVNSKEYARLLAAAHKPEEAVEIFQSILNQDNSRDDIRVELATVYYNLNQYDNAKIQLETVLKNNPSSAEVIYNLGAIEATTGNIDKARELWEKLIADYPESEAAQFASSALQSLN